MYYTKKHYPFQGFFLLFAGLSLLGCTDEDDSYTAAHPGNAIQFSVERIATRTHYEDKYEENGTVYYPIDWDAGDLIFISSADAYPGTSIPGQQYAIYSVAPADDASYHGSITAIDPTSGSVDGAYGLHWGTEENFNKPYTFYGAYPAQRVKGYPTEVENMTSGTLTMQYYTNQVCKITSVENGQYESEPDMMNAYMLAKKTLPTPTQDHILLDFKPIMTTLDIHITAGNYEVATGIIQPVTVTGVSIITPGELKDKELQCNVQDLDEGTISLTNFYPSASSNECVFVGIDNALKSNDEKSFGYVDLFEGESLHLMAFLPPFENVSDGTQIKIHAVGGLSFEFTLKEEQNYFEAQKRIDVQLPDVSPVTTKANDWISQLNNSKLLRTLSIPGYECKKGDDSRLSVLLNMGIRAFDVNELRNGPLHGQDLPQEIIDIFNNFLQQHHEEFIILLYDVGTEDLGIGKPKFELTKDNWNNVTVSNVRGGIISLKWIEVFGKDHYEQEGVYGGLWGGENDLPFGYNKRNDALLIPNSEWTVQYRDMEKDATEIITWNKTNYEAIIKTAIQEGCIGIVMTPYAGEIYADDTYTYSDLLIQSIIDCNFKLH